MAGPHFRINRPGVVAILKGPAMAAAMKRAGEDVGDAARARTDLPIEVHPGMTDRATALVVIADPAGAAEQAKHGVLTGAVGDVGLEVGSR
jgi:hypothetical protein